MAHRTLIEQEVRNAGPVESNWPIGLSDITAMHLDGSDRVAYTDAYINHIDGSDDNLHRTLRRIEDSLVGKWDEFDVIVVTGLSGTVPGAICAHLHGKQLVVVRKDDDITHGVRTEGKKYFVPGTPYIILDDFIANGRTMDRLYTKLRELEHDLPKYTLLYRGATHGDVKLDFGRKQMFIRGKRVNTRGHLYVPYLSHYASQDARADWKAECEAIKET